MAGGQPPMTSLDLLPEATGRGDAAVLVDRDGVGVPRRRLLADMAAVQRLLDRPAKSLVLICGQRSAAVIAAYLAVLRIGHCVAMIDGDGLADRASEFISAFEPSFVVTAADPGARSLVANSRYDRGEPTTGGLWVRRRTGGGEPTIHPSLALLARTSGSMGRSKAIRLSYRNLQSNAVAIAEATAIRAADRVATSLPIDFSFGLSLLNSHLVSGAAVVVTTSSPSSRRFWWQVDQSAVSCVGVVAVTCRMLAAQRWTPERHPSLRHLLVAGGALDHATEALLTAAMERAGGALVPMYGQTEATARIACLRPGRRPAAPGSVGVAIPDGRIELHDPSGVPVADGETGEIVYSGPNVMLGYAQGPADLAVGDTTQGVLRTGDLGRIVHGELHIVGRRDRQVKIMGVRLNLEEVELLLAGDGSGEVAAVTAEPDRVLLLTEGRADRLERRRDELARRLGVASSCLLPRHVDKLPRTPTGKVDHAVLPSVL